MVHSVDWMPAGTFQQPLAAEILAQPLAAWAAEWCGSSLVSVVSAASVPVQPGVQRHEYGTIVLTLSGSGKRRLLEAMLNLDMAQRSLTDGDRHLLEMLLTEAVEDLGKRLQKDLNAPASAPAGRNASFSVVLAGVEILTLSCPEHVLVPLLRQRLPQAPKLRGAPSGRTKALGALRVAADAVLGTAELTAGDLEDLSVGDVLVLNRGLGDPIELRLSSSDKTIARGKLLKHNDRVAIQL